MKKHLYHLLVFSLLGIFAASCSDDDDAPNIQSEIVGEWRLTSWSESAPEGFEVYVEFTSAATFGLYQKVETSNYTKYTGRYSIDGSRLTNGGNTLTMTTRTEPAETSVYSRTIIPDDVRNARTSRAESSLEMRRML